MASDTNPGKRFTKFLNDDAPLFILMALFTIGWALQWIVLSVIDPGYTGNPLKLFTPAVATQFYLLVLTCVGWAAGLVGQWKTIHHSGGQNATRDDMTRYIVWGIVYLFVVLPLPIALLFKAEGEADSTWSWMIWYTSYYAICLMAIGVIISQVFHNNSYEFFTRAVRLPGW